MARPVGQFTRNQPDDSRSTAAPHGESTTGEISAGLSDAEVAEMVGR
jgi:hypothetical protein